MNLIESIELLIKANYEYKKDRKNRKILEKRNKLRYYLFIEIKNSPEKIFALKMYLEEKLFNIKNNNVEKEDYTYILGLYNEAEKLYIESLKNLTLNQKRRFFEQTCNKLLQQKENSKKQNEYVYANI